MGRLVVFLARLVTDGWIGGGVGGAGVGIGVDEKTALLLDSMSGMAQMVGNGTAYIVQTVGAGVPSQCQPDTPLTFDGLTVMRLDATKGLFRSTR